MAQTLYVKVTGADGKPGLKAVQVLRSWQESDGRQIYLHTNGVYGYKDGSPVKDEKELDIIGAPVQRKMALSWWNRVGKDMSAGHYDRETKEIEKRQMEGLPIALDGGESSLDAVTYVRRPLKDKRKSAFGEPAPWTEYGFQQRPDWWGLASGIDLGAWRYEIVDLDEEVPEEPETPAVKETF